MDSPELTKEQELEIMKNLAHELEENFISCLARIYEKYSDVLSSKIMVNAVIHGVEFFHAGIMVDGLNKSESEIGKRLDHFNKIIRIMIND